MKRATLGAGMLAVLLVLGNGAVFASAQTAPTRPLYFTVPQNSGTVLDFGDQTYAVSGGQVVAAAVGGVVLDPGATVTFSLSAQVVGLKISGTATFDLQGTAGGVPVSASGQVMITGALSVAEAGEAGAQACGTAGNPCGEIPVLFGGGSLIQTTTGGVASSDHTVFEVENPYFNPFGAPIILASADGEILIIAIYSVGTIQWQGSEVGGPMVGVIGTSTPVSGMLGLVSNEQEDLVAGTAVDSGTITFSSMTPSALDMSGTYTGSDTIPPPTPQDDCSSMFGLPAGSGVCTMTGFDSQGSYQMSQGTLSVAGTYSTVWTVPAVAFTSTSSAVVTR